MISQSVDAARAESLRQLAGRSGLAARFDPASTTPEYYQLAQWITFAIASGVYAPGMVINGDLIARTLGMPRHTVRKALGLLQRRRIVRRAEGCSHLVVAEEHVRQADSDRSEPSAATVAAVADPEVCNLPGWRPVELFVPAQYSAEQTKFYVHQQIRDIAYDAGEFVGQVRMGSRIAHSKDWSKWTGAYRPGPPGLLL